MDHDCVVQAGNCVICSPTIHNDDEQERGREAARTGGGDCASLDPGGLAEELCSGFPGLPFHLYAVAPVS